MTRSNFQSLVESAAYKGDISILGLAYSSGNVPSIQGLTAPIRTYPESPALIPTCYSGSHLGAEYLTRKGADIAAVNCFAKRRFIKKRQPSFRRPAIITKPATPLYYSARSGNEKTVKLLLGHGAQINSQDTRGRLTALYSAIRRYRSIQSLRMVNLLLSHGADLCARAGNGNTLLHRAAFCGHIELIKLFLTAIDIEDAGYKRRTPLMVSSAAGQSAAVLTLLEYGANVHAKEMGPMGLDSLCLALTEPSRRRDGTMPKPFKPSYQERRRTIEFLRQYGVNIDGTRHIEGRDVSPLSLALGSGDLDATRAILDAGAGQADRSRLIEVWANKTTDWFLRSESADIVQILVDSGADVNRHDEQGETPLTRICHSEGGSRPYHAKLEVIKALVRCGADVGMPCKEELSAYTIVLSNRMNPLEQITILSVLQAGIGAPRRLFDRAIKQLRTSEYWQSIGAKDGDFKSLRLAASLDRTCTRLTDESDRLDVIFHSCH